MRHEKAPPSAFTAHHSPHKPVRPNDLNENSRRSTLSIGGWSPSIDGDCQARSGTYSNAESRRLRVGTLNDHGGCGLILPRSDSAPRYLEAAAGSDSQSVAQLTSITITTRSLMLSGRPAVARCTSHRCNAATRHPFRHLTHPDGSNRRAIRSWPTSSRSRSRRSRHQTEYVLGRFIPLRDLSVQRRLVDDRCELLHLLVAVGRIDAYVFGDARNARHFSLRYLS